MPNIDTEVRTLIAEQLGVDIDEVTDEANLVSDLNADSLELVELLMAVEEQFALDIDEDEAEKLRTVGEVIAFVEGKVNP